MQRVLGSGQEASMTPGDRFRQLMNYPGRYAVIGARSSEFWLATAVKGLFQVGPEILNVLDANAEAHQGFW